MTAEKKHSEIKKLIESITNRFTSKIDIQFLSAKNTITDGFDQPISIYKSEAKNVEFGFYRGMMRYSKRIFIPDNQIVNQACDKITSYIIDNFLDSSYDDLTNHSSLMSIKTSNKLGIRSKSHQIIMNSIYQIINDYYLGNYFYGETVEDQFINGRNNSIEKAKIDTQDPNYKINLARLIILNATAIDQGSYELVPLTEIFPEPYKTKIQQSLVNVLTYLNDDELIDFEKFVFILYSFIVLLNLLAELDIDEDKKVTPKKESKQSKETGEEKSKDGKQSKGNGKATPSKSKSKKGKGSGLSAKQSSKLQKGYGNGNQEFSLQNKDMMESGALTKSQKEETKRLIRKAFFTLDTELNHQSKKPKEQSKNPLEELAKSDSLKMTDAAPGIGMGYDHKVPWHESKFVNAQNQMTQTTFSQVLTEAMQASEIVIQNKKQTQNATPDSFKIWNLGEPIRDLLIKKTISKDGMLLPGRNTLKYKHRLGQSSEDRAMGNLIVFIDTSGSMQNSMKNAIEAAMATVYSFRALYPDGNTSIITFDSVATEICKLTKDISLIERRTSKIFASGGTVLTAAIKLGIEHIQLMRKANILIITDAGIHDFYSERLESEMRYLSELTLSFVTVFLGRISLPQKAIKKLNATFNKIKVYSMKYGDKFTDAVLNTMI